MLDASLVRHWYDATESAFSVHRRTIDALNVFPVPDGDTGTNLAATMHAACVALTALDEAASLQDITARAARGALLGARGNSGVILAQLLRGFADRWNGDNVDAAALAAGMRHACDSAREAVAAPAEGTILTVARAAATAAERHAAAELPEAVTAISGAASTALADTIDQLPALTRAGVVDAGGLGLALMLDTLAELITGIPVDAALRAADAQGRTARSRVAAEVPRESGSPDYAYEVQYLLDAEPEAVERLRDTLTELGDSLVVVGAATSESTAPIHSWNVHIHVNDVGAAVEAGIRSGRLYRLSVTRFSDDVTREAGNPSPPSTGERGIVVIAEGARLAQVLSAEGAHPISGSRPSTHELLVAMRATGGSDIVVLTDDANAAVAEAAAGLARGDGYRVAVIPTRSPVQALAALAVRDASRRFDDDVIAMAEAAGACRHAEVTVAARAGLTSAGRCESGDYLGLADGDVILFGDRLDAVLCTLVDRLCGAGAELITIVAGSQLPADSTDTLAAHLASAWPLVEAQFIDGGQPRHLVWIGAE